MFYTHMHLTACVSIHTCISYWFSNFLYPLVNLVLQKATSSGHPAKLTSLSASPANH